MSAPRIHLDPAPGAPTAWMGPCTCRHLLAHHGSEGCLYPGCECEAHWADGPDDEFICQDCPTPVKEPGRCPECLGAEAEYREGGSA